MGFVKLLFGGITRDLTVKQLKAEFSREFPGEAMKGTLEGYCGTGMLVAQSINDRTSARIHLLDAFELELAQEKERHRRFAKMAYEIGVETHLEK